MFQIETGLVSHLESNISAVDYNNIISNLEVAEKYFFDYLGFVMRNHMQQKRWSDLMNERKMNEAFCIVDFSMKILPSKYRAPPEFWFAQAGVTTHIAVFKRTIEVDGVKKTETTVYASIIEGNDKQDANMVMCILESVFRHYKASNSNIEDLYLKSGMSTIMCCSRSTIFFEHGRTLNFSVLIIALLNIHSL